MIRTTWRFIFFALILTIAGCSKWSAGKFSSPNIELVNVEVVKAKLLEQEFILHFRIDNPNPMMLPVNGMAYSLQLNGMRLAEGDSNVRFTVPAHGTKHFQIPAHTNLWRHMKEVVKLLKKPDRPVLYKLEAEVQTGLLLAHKVQLNRSGEIIPGTFITE